MLLLSIRPEYVDRILAGEKLVELRRRRPRCTAGDCIAIYCSAPRMELVAVVGVNEVRVKSPESLWREVRTFSGVSRSTYRDYFEGADRAVGIMISGVQRLREPIPLNELRTEWPGFHPPQGFRYLTATQIAFLSQNLDAPLPHGNAA